MFLSIVIFIFILGLLILVHEAGHFIVAKRRGVRVEEFGFGFPPRLFGVKKGETVYSLNLIPLGGFVKLFGESPDGVTSQEKEALVSDRRSFAFRPIGERALIVTAGVAGNLLLAWLLFSLAHGVGLTGVIDDGEREENYASVAVVVVGVSPSSPAERGGIRPGDTILRLRDLENREKLAIGKVAQVQSFVKASRDRVLAVTVLRDGEKRELDVLARSNPPPGEGALGIALARTGTRSYRLHRALLQGALTTAALTRSLIVGLGSLFFTLFSQGRLIADVAGPVGILVLSREAARLGFSTLIFFTGILSLNLAIINVLPFPALDGGRLLFLAVEKLKGSPVSRRAERLAHTAGFAFLIALMLLITYRDVARLF